MSTSIIPQLVIKDLKLARPLVVGATAVGFLSLAVLPWSRIAFYVGSISFMVTLVLLNVLIVSNTLINERKEKTRLLVLSLPVSTLQYNVAKVLSSLLAFVVPTALLTAAAVLLLVLTPLPNGFIPVTVALAVHCLLYFCVFLAFALITDSPGWMTAVIVGGNVSLTFVINYLFTVDSVGANVATETTVWGPELMALMAIEIAVSLLALVVSFVVYLRKTEFV